MKLRKYTNQKLFDNSDCSVEPPERKSNLQISVVPNILESDVPSGTSDGDNKIIRTLIFNKINVYNKKVKTI